MPDHGAVIDARSRADMSTARDDRPAELRVALDDDAIPEERVGDHRARRDRAIVAEYGVRSDHGVRRDATIAPDEHRRPDRRSWDRLAAGAVDLGGQPKRHD